MSGTELTGDSVKNDSREKFPLLWKKRLPALLISSGWVLIFAFMTHGGILHGITLNWWTDFGWTISSLIAAVHCWQTARVLDNEHEKHAWTWFGAAAFAWFIGMLIWDYLELVSTVITPFPALSDYFFMTFAVFFVVGMLNLRAEAMTRYVTWIQIGNLGVIVTTVIIVVSVVLHPQVINSDESRIFIIFAIGYPVIFMSALLYSLYSYWFFSWGKNRYVVVLLLFAIGTHAVTDTLYGFELLGKSYGASNYLNVLWVLAFVFQFWASYERRLVQFDTPDVTATGSSKKLEIVEGLVPSVSLLIILMAIIFYVEEIDLHLAEFLLYVSILFVVFLGVREWWIGIYLGKSRAELEKEVENRTIELLSTNKELESFCYSVSHDLRAPLRSINGFSQALREDYGGQLDNTARDYLARVAAATRRMAELIDALLDLSRVSREDFKKQTVNLSEIAEEIVAALSQTEPDRQVAFNITPGLVVQGDEAMLRSLLQNLLSNAYKYSRKTNAAVIEFGKTIYRHKPCYYVKDNGIGFDMQYVNKLFNAFQRLHEEQEFEGTGIGLATVQRIIQRHGGEIWVKSEPDKGATFYFTLE